MLTWQFHTSSILGEQMRSRVKFKIGSLLVAASLMLTGCGADTWGASENKGYSDTPPEEFPESIDEALERHGFGEDHFEHIFESHIEQVGGEMFDYFDYDAYDEVEEAALEEFSDDIVTAAQENESFREEFLFAMTDRGFTMSEELPENVAAFRDLGSTACRVVPDAELAKFFTEFLSEMKEEKDLDLDWLVPFIEKTGGKLEQAVERHPVLAGTLNEEFTRDSRAQEEVVFISVMGGSATYCPSAESWDYLDFFLRDWLW